MMRVAYTLAVLSVAIPLLPTVIYRLLGIHGSNGFAWAVLTVAACLPALLLSVLATRVAFEARRESGGLAIFRGRAELALLAMPALLITIAIVTGAAWLVGA